MVATSAVEGPSNIPGYSIAAGMTSPASKGTAAILSTATQASNAGGSGINTDLALGLGLGLGISALLAVAAIVYVLHSRKARQVDFERRAERIRETVETAKTRPVAN